MTRLSHIIGGTKHVLWKYVNITSLWVRIKLVGNNFDFLTANFSLLNFSMSTWMPGWRSMHNSSEDCAFLKLWEEKYLIANVTFDAMKAALPTFTLSKMYLVRNWYYVNNESRLVIWRFGKFSTFRFSNHKRKSWHHCK